MSIKKVEAINVLIEKQESIAEDSDPLEDIEDEWFRADLAIAIENQKLFNEVSDHKGDAEFATASLAAAKLGLTKSIARHIVSVQSMLGPTGNCYWTDSISNLLCVEPVSAITSMWSCNLKMIDVDAMGQALANKINREIFDNLLNNAGSRLIWDVSAVDGDTLKEKVTDLVAIVKKTRQVIKAQSKKEEANWCVTSPTCADLLSLGGMNTSYKNFHELTELKQVGSLWDMCVYCDPKFPPHTILMGYKGPDAYDSGYFYLPYIMLCQIEAREDGMRAIFTRNAKKMKKGGQNYYAKLMIDNF